MKASELVRGGFYNWKNQPERLVFVGKFGSWNQFAKVGTTEVWCKVLDEDMYMLEPITQKTYNFGQLEQLARLAREYVKAVDAIDGQPTEEQFAALKLAADILTTTRCDYESL